MWLLPWALVSLVVGCAGQCVEFDSWELCFPGTSLCFDVTLPVDVAGCPSLCGVCNDGCSTYGSFCCLDFQCSFVDSDAKCSGEGCLCSAGYEGDYCDNRVGWCSRDDHCGYKTPGGGFVQNGHCVGTPAEKNMACAGCTTGVQGDNCEIFCGDCCTGGDCQRFDSGATCLQETSADYQRCKCTVGFEGKHCENNCGECCKSADCRKIDALATCDGIVLRNSTSGYDKVREYTGTTTCSCTRGYSGRNCDVFEGQCSVSSECNSVDGGAICAGELGSRVCLCSAGYQGERCDDFCGDCCNTVQCNDNACVPDNTRDMMVCQCRPGYSGVHCEEYFGDCVVDADCNSESSASTCGPRVDESGEIGLNECKCEPGYNGFYCENFYGFCFISSDCNEIDLGAVCVNATDGNRCKCSTPGYLGAFCKPFMGVCSIDKNCREYGDEAALCVGEAPTKTCSCTVGKTGQYCENHLHGLPRVFQFFKKPSDTRTGVNLPVLTLELLDEDMTRCSEVPDLAINLTVAGGYVNQACLLNASQTFTMVGGAVDIAGLAITTATLASFTIIARMVAGEYLPHILPDLQANSSEAFEIWTPLCPAGERNALLNCEFVCLPCSPGTFSFEVGQTSCDPCPPETYSVSGETSCHPCPVGGDCTGGTLRTQEGYWGDEENSEMYQCQFKNAECHGGEQWAASCVAGHTGKLCGTCVKPEYARAGSSCQKCGNEAEAYTLVILYLVFMAAILIYFIVSALAEKTPPSLILKILLNYLQMTALVGQFKSQTSDIISGYFGFSKSSSASVDIFPIRCLTGADHYDFFTFYAGAPLVFALAAPTVVALVRAAVGKFCGLGKAKPFALADDAGVAAITVYIFLYPSVTEKALSMFYCNELGLLYADMSIDCTTAEHSSYIVAAVFCVLVYTVGIPLLMMAVLYFKSDLIGSPKMPNSFFILFNGYHHGAYFWDLFVLLRKSITIVFVVFIKDARGQMLAGATMIGFSMLGHLYLAPFKEQRFNVAETLSHLVVLITLLSTGVFIAPDAVEHRDAVAINLLILNIIFLVGMVVFLIVVVLPQSVKNKLPCFATVEEEREETVFLDVNDMEGTQHGVLDSSDDDDDDCETRRPVKPAPIPPSDDDVLADPRPAKPAPAPAGQDVPAPRPAKPAPAPAPAGQDVPAPRPPKPAPAPAGQDVPAPRPAKPAPAPASHDDLPARRPSKPAPAPASDDDAVRAPRPSTPAPVPELAARRPSKPAPAPVSDVDDDVDDVDVDVDVDDDVETPRPPKPAPAPAVADDDGPAPRRPSKMAPAAPPPSSSDEEEEEAGAPAGPSTAGAQAARPAKPPPAPASASDDEFEDAVSARPSKPAPVPVSSDEASASV